MRARPPSLVDDRIAADAGDQPDPLVLDVDGMTCAACAGRVERALQQLEGVRASVNVAAQRAFVTGLAPQDVARAIRLVAQAGYSAAVHADDEGAVLVATARLSALRRRLAVTSLLTIALCNLTIMFVLAPGLRFPGWESVCAALAAPVVTWGAWPFHRAAISGVRNRATSMDTLVSLGTLASFGWALHAMVVSPSATVGYWSGFAAGLLDAHPIYLDVAAGMVTFQLAGRYYESRSRRAAGDVLRAIGNLAVTQARVLRDGVEAVVPIRDLVQGDLFAVLPGERVAADGTVRAGRSTIDTSAMSGETTPVEVEPGALVIGGTVNVSGRLVVEAVSVGPHSRLAQIAATAEAAQRHKARAQRLVDRVSAVFVPAVMALAVVVTAAWLAGGAAPGRAVSIGIAVLVVACPCALGLATPIALMVGVGRGSQLGILIKCPEALEASGAVDTVVLDKTGTVTTGALRLVTIKPLGSIPRERVLSLAAAVESGSGHAVAAAVLRAARAERIALRPVTDFAALPGLGARGTVEGRQVLLGNAELLSAQGVQFPADDELRRLQDAGLTAVFLAVDGVVWGMLGLGDTIKPSARPAVEQLRALGLRTVLLTGDSRAATRQVAEYLEVDEVIAQVLPADKARVIADLQARGHRVAMVGDGVNDAAALATSDLGMALVKGTDIAMEAADVIVVRDDLRAVVDAVLLSRRTLRTIRGNLAWAVGYNLAALPLAMAGLLNPLIAAAAMALSSTVVVSTSLRLRNFEPHTPAGSPGGPDQQK